MSAAVAATVIAGSQIVSSAVQSHAAKKAAEAQSKAAKKGIQAEQEQFNKLQEILKPYVDSGVPALEAQKALIGLGEPGAEEAAIKNLQEAPLFKGLVSQGENAILQNASATGGLRGGNVQQALAKFRPDLLNKVIQDRFNRLGEITKTGQNSAVGVGTAGTELGRNTAEQLNNIGTAQAQSQLATGKAIGDAVTTAGEIYGAKKLGLFDKKTV